MNYTKKYPQVSKAACQAKYRRMKKGCGCVDDVRGNGRIFMFKYLNTLWWMDRDYSGDGNMFAIFAFSTIQVESEIDKIYKTNCKHI